MMAHVLDTANYDTLPTEIQTPEADAVLSFKVGPYALAAPARTILAVIEPPRIHRLPVTGNGFIGVISFRNQLTRVVSIRQKLGLENLMNPTEGQFIVSRLSDGVAAFQIDSVMDMISMDGQTADESPGLAPFTSFHRYFLKDNQILFLIDFETLFKMDAPIKPKKKPVLPPTKEDASPAQKTSPEKDTCTQNHQKPTEPADESHLEKKAVETPSADCSCIDRVKASQTTKAGAHPLPPFIKSSQHNPSRDNRLAARSFVAPIQVPSKPNPSEFRKPFFYKNSKSFLVATVLALFALTVALWFYFREDTVDKSNMTESRPAFTVSASSNNTSDTGMQGIVSPSDHILATPPADIIKDHQKPHNLQPETIAKLPAEQPDGEAPESKAVNRKKEAPTDTKPAQPPVDEKLADLHPTIKVLDISTKSFSLSVERPLNPMKKKLRSAKAERPGVIIYIVVKGDTLWEIATEYLGDPWKYPQLAQLSHIKDPDWIYPGDIVRIVNSIDEPENHVD